MPGSKKSSKESSRANRADASSPSASDNPPTVGGAGDPKAQAIDELQKSIDALQTTYDTLSGEVDDPATTDTEQRAILQELGPVRAELESEQFFLLHLKRADITVSPPDATAGQELADALGRLQRLKGATDQLTLLLDLAAKITDDLATHRRDVSSRTNA